MEQTTNEAVVQNKTGGARLKKGAQNQAPFGTLIKTNQGRFNEPDLRCKECSSFEACRSLAKVSLQHGSWLRDGACLRPVS